MTKKILVAEDEATSRAVTLKCLESAGYATLVATDGVQALEAAEAARPDLIILDLLLPRRDGYAVLLDLRSRAVTRDTPVLILSGEDGESHAAVARALGAQDFIGKPFKRDAFLSRVEKILSGGGR